MKLGRVRALALFSAVLTSAVLAAEPPSGTPASPAAGDALGSLPRLQPGLWQFQRTLTISASRGQPQKALVKKCSDPSKDFEQKIATMKQKGCKFGPMTRDGNHYRSTWMCPVQGGSLSMSNTITVNGATSYEDVSEAHYAQRTTRTSIVATRLGDCPAGATAAAGPIKD